MIRVPLLFRRPQNPLWYLVLWLPYIALYQLSNRFPILEPRQLSMSVIDQTIPFVPALLPLYLMYLPLYWWTGIRSESDERANRLCYASYFQMLLCLPVFVLFPVEMPRELFYGTHATGWADGFWHWFDAPRNCLPSLHAANCLLLMHFNRTRCAPGLHGVLAAGIIASTLLVKQHYAVDLVVGALVYAATVVFLRRLVLVPRPALTSDSAYDTQRSGGTGTDVQVHGSACSGQRAVAASQRRPHRLPPSPSMARRYFSSCVRTPGTDGATGRADSAGACSVDGEEVATKRRCRDVGDCPSGWTCSGEVAVKCQTCSPVRARRMRSGCEASSEAVRPGTLE